MPEAGEQYLGQEEHSQPYKRIKIGGHIFEVIYKDLTDIECIGLCKHHSNVIYVQPGLKPTREREVILHECVHAISEFMNLGLDESQVERLGEGLFMLLQDNTDIQWTVGPVNT